MYGLKTRCSTPNESLSLVHVRTLATQSGHFRHSYRQHRVNGLRSLATGELVHGCSLSRARVELFATVNADGVFAIQN